ncbi:hypothetical protein [Cupriavidus sp. TKC]|uniref:hypothetical protein n=1 Tax=Cupriavidus sp. TKC TaxID=2880159 RepID=UPI00295E6B8F|nr:hypothetical protein [Cupriavidus sp. TKC]
MSQTCQCKCKVCKKEFTAKVADRKRGWAKCCSKSCAAIRRTRQNGGYQPARREVFGDEEQHLFADAHLFSNEEHDCNKD